MGFNNAAMTVGANAIKAVITHAQLHSADPGAGGTSNAHSGRMAITWGSTSADGDFALSSPLEFSGLTPGANCTHVSLWSASTSGTHYGNVALSGDTEANSEGEFTVTALTVDGSSS